MFIDNTVPNSFHREFHLVNMFKKTKQIHTKMHKELFENAYQQTSSPQVPTYVSEVTYKSVDRRYSTVSHVSEEGIPQYN